MTSSRKPLKRYEYHGLSTAPEYKVWQTMIDRCHNPRAQKYPAYGARGITVCDRWRDSFQAFMDDMGRRSENTSVERRENDGGYEPGNCYWATASEQAQNKRRYASNKTGLSGVTWYAQRQRYYAHIRQDGVRTGFTTDDFFEACAWRKSAENKRAAT